MAQGRVARGIVVLSVLVAGTVRAQEPAPAAKPVLVSDLAIAAATGEITIDGDLGDAGWTGAQPIATWYEISPGTNLAPKVKSVARLAFDSRFLYASFEFEDPDPAAIRAPLTDRDNALTSSDYAGVIIDSRHDGRTAQEFLANPRGVQYDGIWSDLVGEDLAPDFYWTAAGRITATGWNLEIRIPFSSLRYDTAAAPVWGITLFRNYPRAFRYEIATAPQPSDAPCFICNQNRLVGLSGLPAGGSWVAAPFVVAKRRDAPADGILGAPLDDGDVEFDAGLDLKWTPSSRQAIDLTINPDFSQVESDVAQLTTNQQFALLFPEKRPFFLEQADLFSTPLAAVYTRTITAPRAGLRLTGRGGNSSYTVLVTQDRGGGSVILPGTLSSDLAPQDYESYALVGRLRHDIGSSFVSFLASAREIDGDDGGGFNRVVGPDFQWRPRASDTVAGQLLWSSTETPDRPDLASVWDGRELEGHAAYLLWQHDDGVWDWYLEGQDVDQEFRADNGFVPQVGFRHGLVEFGKTWDATGGLARSLSKIRLFSFDQYATDEDGEVIAQILSAGFELRGARNLFLRLRYTSDDIRVEDRLLARQQPRLLLRIAPSAVFANLELTAYAGTDIDFDNAREGDGAGAAIEATLRPTDRLELRANVERNILDVDPTGPVPEGRLFTADLLRLRATWTFTPRMFLRAIGQRVETERAPDLYTFAVDDREVADDLELLLAYKLNWQSIAYLGYAEGKTFLPASAHLERNGREIFFKLSYAIQR
jgi:hypothetical protein